MFIRRTRTNSTASGEAYFTYRLVRTQREGGKVRQITLLNLGRHFELDQALWSDLCGRIDEILGRQKRLFKREVGPNVELEAQRIAAQLLSRQTQIIPVEQQGSSTMQTVDVESLSLSRPRSVGVEQVGLWAMEQVDFPGMLARVGLTAPQRAAVIGLIIGRMARPGSELATHDWLRNHSGLGELIATDFETMSLMQLYRASDQLMRHRQQLEEALFAKLHNLFGLDCTITLYDLTNTYFEGEAGGNAKARHGKSKEKRSDCPLLTLGVVLDGSGFVRRSQVFAGNTAEGSTLEQMLLGLGAPDRALVIMDRGLASEANLAWLQERGYRYLVVSREQRRHFNADEAVTLQTASQGEVRIHKELSEDGREVRLYCHSELRAKKETGIVERFAKKFEAGLNQLAEGLSKPRTTKKLAKVWERIGRLKEKSRGAGHYYQIDVTPDATGTKALAIHWQRQARPGTMLTHPGVYCLRSNETSWDEKRLWQTYIMLTDLEAVFRTLKSELGLRPIYHHKEDRGDGHLFITVLAYQMVQIIRRRLKAQDISGSWSTLRGILGNQHRITATFRRADGRTLHIRKATKPEAAQEAIYRALGSDGLVGGVKQVIV